MTTVIARASPPLTPAPPFGGQYYGDEKQNNRETTDDNSNLESPPDRLPALSLPDWTAEESIRGRVSVLLRTSSPPFGG